MPRTMGMPKRGQAAPLSRERVEPSPALPERNPQACRGRRQLTQAFPLVVTALLPKSGIAPQHGLYSANSDRGEERPQRE